MLNLPTEDIDTLLITISTLVKEEQWQELEKKISGLHFSLVSDLLRNLNNSERILIFASLSQKFYLDYISNFSVEYIREIINIKGVEFVINIINYIDDNNVTLDIIQNLSEEEQSFILHSIVGSNRVLLENQLTYPKDSAGRLMKTDFISVFESWTVEKVLHYIKIMKERGKIHDDKLHDIFVVNGYGEPVYGISLANLLFCDNNTKIKELVKNDFISVDTNCDQEEVALLFRNRFLSSLAVINQSKVLIGVITINEVINVIYQETQEDLLLLSGVSEDTNPLKNQLKISVLSNFFGIALKRFRWLTFNFIEALFIPFIILMFKDTLSENVILSALIQFVVALGGNAGMQSMAVTLRSITLKLIAPSNLLKPIIKELKLAFINATLLGIIAALWGYLFMGNLLLGIVGFSAVWINIILGTLFGTLYPIVLKKMNIDPAVAGAICITTSTDIIGFFLVLLIASRLLA